MKIDVLEILSGASSTIVVVGAMSLAFVAAANETNPNPGPSTSKLIELQTDGTYVVSRDLDELGDAAVSVILCALEQARQEAIWREVPMLMALMRANSKIATHAVLQYVEQVWNEKKHLSLSHHEVIEEIRKQKLRSACSFLKRVMNAASPELRQYAETDKTVSTGSEYEQYFLSPAILSADAIVSMCEGTERQAALDFLMSCVPRLPVGDDSISQHYLTSALAPIIDQSAVAEAYVLKEIDICSYPSSEMFRRLPRDTQSVSVVKALYETLDQETGMEAALDTGPEIAMFEALSEMELSASIVPKDFWPKYWDSRKDRFLSFVREQQSTKADQCDLRARLQSILNRHGLTP